MPQPFDSGDELSLRHLPDVSNSSFSFQIPGATRGDNLLADNILDFFQGADVSIAPLASPLPAAPDPLFTLSQLTPKPTLEKLPISKDGSQQGSFPTLSYDHSDDHDTNPKQRKANLPELSKATTNVDILSKPKPKVIVAPSIAAKIPVCEYEGSPAAVRVGNLRAELDLFNDNDNLLVGPSTTVRHQTLPMPIHRRPKGILRKSLEKKEPQLTSRNNQKVVEGGISKTRCATTKLSSMASRFDGVNSLPIQNATITDSSSRSLSQQTEQANGDLSFADSSINSVQGGVAGRLVMYSQQLINSIGSLEPNGTRHIFDSQDPEAGTDMEVVQDREVDRPLTVSQLSPQKAVSCRSSTPTPRDDRPKSPLRLPSKRPVSVASDVVQKRKKRKNDASSADVSVAKPKSVLKTRLPSTKRYPKPIASISSSGSRANDRSAKRKPTSTRVNGPGITQPPAFKSEEIDLNGDGDNDKDAKVASSRCAGTSGSIKNSNEKEAEPVNSIGLNNKGKGVASSGQGSFRVHALQTATRPVAFNFQTDKRSVDAQKDKGTTNGDRERNESQRLHSSTTIPDFKAMHAAQEAELALRKENIQPVVPLPIRWETDYRVKERQKFDERIREKEREQERVMEERRREREEEEEREVRELRKKAIPKAHEVPEWYKEAPKKKKGC